MKKRLFFNKILFLVSISSSLFLFSCGKLGTETKDANGNVIEFEDIKDKDLSSNVPIEQDYSSYNIRQSLDKVMKYTYTTPTTDKEKKETHTVTIKYGIGDLLYDNIKNYENEVDLYVKTQEIKLSMYRISYSDLHDYAEAKAIYSDPINWTNIDMYRKMDLIYTETNTLGYYFSEDFKYGNLEYTDTITKDSIITNTIYNGYEHDGMLHYCFMLEPVNSSDQIIKFGRLANVPGAVSVATKEGYKNINWEKGDYVFPIEDLTYNDVEYKVNYPALEVLPSMLNAAISYKIDGDNVTFYTKEEY